MLACEAETYTGWRKKVTPCIDIRVPTKKIRYTLDTQQLDSLLQTTNVVVKNVVIGTFKLNILCCFRTCLQYAVYARPYTIQQQENSLTINHFI